MSHHASEVHWHAEPYPLLVGFGAGFFLPWVFMFQFVYHQGLFSIISLTLAVILLLSGGVGWVGATVGVIKDEGWSPSAMLMFIGTEVMTIAGLLIAYWVMRVQAPVWPPEGTPELFAPIFATLLLISSSVTAGLARKKQMTGDASGFIVMTLVTIAIWVIFGGLNVMSWSNMAEQGFTIGINAYATALYGITGIYFAHIIFGVLVLLLALPPAFKGRLSDSYARSMTMYVHFVNILSVWVLLKIYYW